MDFKALLAKEIARKKNVASKATGDSNGKKFVSQAELQRAENDIQRQKQLNLDKERNQKAEKLKRRREEEQQEEEIKKQRREEKKIQDKSRKEEEARRIEELSKVDGLEESKLTDEELTKKFRARNEPSFLFAETRSKRIYRLHLLHERDLEEKRERELDEKENSIDMEIQKQDIKDDPEKVYIQMRATVRTILSEWEQVLNENPDTTDDAMEILNQTKAFTDPLLAQLRKQNLGEQLYPKLAELLMHLQQHRYREANDIYIKMSIGNATWPVGVTAVGIHARSSRERITGYGNEKDSSIQVAHIMSDDATRKWHIALKRFLTFAEGHLQNKSFKS